MRILIAPQEFKGTLTAARAARALQRALSRALPDAELDVAPLADGGRGTVELLLDALGGEPRTSVVRDPLGRPVAARWGLLDGGRSAVVEMAAASGLTLLSPAERDPRRTSTFGTGEIIAVALDTGCQRIIVGLGGSATNDGGAGAASALGVRFLDASGAELPPGGAALARLDRIDLARRDPRLARVELILAADVRNVLLGPSGASAVYGPQKGAGPAAVAELDAALARLAAVARSQLGIHLADVPGSGAAGGLAYGLTAFAGGRITPGFELLANVLDLEGRIARADLVITGEGRLDAQTRQGKGPGALAALARGLEKRTILFAGAVAPGFDRATSSFDEVVTTGGQGLSPEELARKAEELLEAAAEAWARSLAGR